MADFQFQNSQGYDSPFNFGKGQGVGGDLQGMWSKVSGDALAGRPGALNAIYNLLDTIGKTTQLGQGQAQFNANAPFMADAGQANRAQFQAQAPYMTDPYEQQRWQFGQAQQLAAVRNPYLSQFYNQATQDLTSPYRAVLNGQF